MLKKAGKRYALQHERPYTHPLCDYILADLKQSSGSQHSPSNENYGFLTHSPFFDSLRYYPCEPKCRRQFRTCVDVTLRYIKIVEILISLTVRRSTPRHDGASCRQRHESLPAMTPPCRPHPARLISPSVLLASRCNRGRRTHRAMTVDGSDGAAVCRKRVSARSSYMTYRRSLVVIAAESGRRTDRRCY